MTDWSKPIDYSKIDLSKIDWSDGIEEIPDDDLGAQNGGAAPSAPKYAQNATARAELDEWDAGDLLCSGMPAPRQWLYGRQLCRRFLSSLVAPGDVGKTTKRLTQAIELAIGRELLGHRIYQRCCVLVVSLEDDRDELWRRLLAICKHHRVDPNELKRWLFCRDLNGVKLVEAVDGERQSFSIRS